AGIVGRASGLIAELRLPCRLGNILRAPGLALATGAWALRPILPVRAVLAALAGKRACCPSMAGCVERTAGLIPELRLPCRLVIAVRAPELAVATTGSLRKRARASPATEEFALAGVPKNAPLPARSRTKNPSRWKRRSKKNRS